MLEQPLEQPLVMETSHPSQDAAVESSDPSLSPSPSTLPSNGAARKRPRKLTPLEKKERDRQRKKEQAQRRRQAELDKWSQAKLLEQAKGHSSTWHANVRQEEELLLLRLDRDAVDAQRVHPAAAGYAFQLPGTPNNPLESETRSPVFLSYSHPLCPPLEDAASNFRRQITKNGSSSGSRVLRTAAEAAFWHPASHGYAMARNDDCTRVSPVFFHSGFAKISLEQVANDARESAQSAIDVGDSSSEEEEGAGARERVSVRHGK